MTFKLLLSPIICALIGWVTNYLAVKMLFHPHKPIKVWPFVIQGIFPKRQNELAESLGRMIEKELISHEDIKSVICDPSFIEKHKVVVLDYLDVFFKEKVTTLHPMVSMFLNDDTMKTIRGMLSTELDEMLPKLIQTTSSQLENSLDFKCLVQKKVENFSMEQLENILFSIMKKEFRFIEIFGGVLGFIIGLIQIFIFI
ncbi:DUF445 domain-containing protein [Maridesulfovibrio bastinii]|jgi:uncharacterized membrane protein YheB (UPF0754 family)|uniref:DUF445 domain-containing protein n=1 Tax=Maridesulfovibrio bastinii TaxID=47157 RepID=UPI00040EE230|nr:DUF445 family protein [Maridesulfovibrio bastinii]